MPSYPPGWGGFKHLIIHIRSTQVREQRGAETDPLATSSSVTKGFPMSNTSSESVKRWREKGDREMQRTA